MGLAFITVISEDSLEEFVLPVPQPQQLLVLRCLHFQKGDTSTGNQEGSCLVTLGFLC